MAKLSDPTESSFNYLYNKYRCSARDEKREFALTKPEVRELVKQSCHYCGIAPTQAIRAWHAREVFIYNGIDRKDNSRGYEMDNCLPCCSRCNFMKRAMGYDEFIEAVRAVTRHLGVA